MGLIGKTTEEKIWNFLKSKGLSDYGAAGLMGNLFAESGLNPQNLQNSYEKKLGHTDASYRAAVDNGSYGNFARDGAGYGPAQWTYHTRKAALLEYAKAAGKSIGDLETQLGFLMKELTEGYNCSDISYIVRSAARKMFNATIKGKTDEYQPISQTLLEKVISKKRPSVSGRDLREYERVRSEFSPKDDGCRHATIGFR